MKKNYELLAGFAVMFLYLGFVGLFGNPAHADTRTSSYRVVNKSSTTSTRDTLVRVPASSPGDLLASVIVSTCGSANSSFAIYNSSAQSANLIAPIGVSSLTVTGPSGAECRNQYHFDFAITSAITYSNLGTLPATVTILWFNQGDNR